jgi:homoserine O-succinyltransferase/O-acetyltransferase
MTIVLPKDYHSFDLLKTKRIEVMNSEEALRQDIRALRIGILNIMPKAQDYEFNLLFPLGRSVLQIDPVWIRLKTHEYVTTDKLHLEKLYVTFEDAIRENILDGLIVTGAPVEEIPFEEVEYWNELCSILTYARKNIASTLGLCWGGLALAKMLGIEKMKYPKKVFGVFESRNLDREHPVTGEIDDVFFCPQSRHAGISDSVLEAERDIGNIRLLAHSKDAGYFIFESSDKKFLVHLGHPEYNSRRLVEETLRDRKKGRKDVGDPVNFDIENPVNRWRSQRNEFFTQWIKYVYEHTDLSK